MKKSTNETFVINNSSKFHQYIITAIESISSVIHQYSTNTSSNNDHLETLQRQFEHIRFSMASNDNLLSRFECIYPFCLVIKENKFPTSMICIKFLTNLLNYSSFINPNSLHIEQCIQLMGNTICCIDLNNLNIDLKFTHLIFCLFNNSCFIFLSADNIWNILKILLSIYFNSTNSKHLFEYVEITIKLLIQKVFLRLPQLLNKNKTTNEQKQNKIETPKTQFNTFILLKQKILNKNDTLNVNNIDKFKLCEAFNIECLIGIIAALVSMQPLQYFDVKLNISNNGTPVDQIIFCLKLILIIIRESGSYFVKVPRILSLITNNLGYILITKGNTNNIIMYELCLKIYIELLYKLKHKMKLQNEILFKILFLNKIEEENKQDLIICKIALEHCLDLCNSKFFIKELFLNHDYSLYSTNLCNDLILILSKYSIPGKTHILSDINYLSVQCICNITNALTFKFDGFDQQEEEKEEETNQKKKNILMKAIDIFNDNCIEKGMQYLFENYFFGNDICYNNTNIGVDIIDKIVDILFYCNSIKNEKIGNYLGLGDKLNTQLRNRYIERRYSFNSMLFDDAMKLFFEDFVLPKETQMIDRIIHTFSDKYCKDNKYNNNWNISSTNTYTLCFALMMLHTNQHNKNIKFIQTFEQFIGLIKHVNDTNSIDIKILENLYHSMTTKQMKMSHDHYTLCDWNTLCSSTYKYKYINYYNQKINNILNILYDPILTTYCILFDVVKENEKKNIIMDKLMQYIIYGFYNLSLSCNNLFGNNNKMDLIINRLCQLTGLNEIGNLKSGLKYSQSYCKKEISHLLFNILYSDFGANIITEKGWNSILLIIIQCAKVSLLPTTMYQLDDFVGGKNCVQGRNVNRSFTYLYNIDQQSNDNTEQTFGFTHFIGKFLDVFNTPIDDLLTEQKQKEKKLLNSAQKILTDYCKINILFKKSSLYCIESLRCLIKILIQYSNFGLFDINNNKTYNIEIKTYNIDNITHIIYINKLTKLPLIQCGCLCTQFLTSIVLHNSHRLQYIWDLIVKHFKQLLDIKLININKQYKPLYECMLESIIIGLLKICVRGIQLQCNQYTQCIMSSINLISNLCIKKINIFESYPNVSRQIVAGTHQLIKKICNKKLLYLRHKTSIISPSSSIASLSSLSSQHLMREHHARRMQSDYKWWKILNWNHIFIIIKSTSSKYNTIAARMFLYILGVFDDSDNDYPFINNHNNNEFYSKIAFLPNHPIINMDNLIDLFNIFISQNSNQSIRIMIVKGICNVLEEMEYFYHIIRDNNKPGVGDINKEPGVGDINNDKEIKLKIFKYIRVFIIYLIKLCGSLCSVIRTKALLLLEYILSKSAIAKIFINNNLHFIKDIILNVLCSELIMIQLSSLKNKNVNNDINSFQLITESRIFALQILYTYFLANLNALNYNNCIRDVWMKILCCTDCLLEMKSDPKYNQLYACIKQKMKHLLNVMIDNNIINEQDDDNKTWNKIHDMFPRMKQELFCNNTRIEQQLKINEKYVSKDIVDVSSSEVLVLVD